MIHADHSFRMSRVRSADIVDHTALEKSEVIIIGAGAIGSNTALLLAKLGVGRLVIFDNQDVGEENIEPQLYCYGDIGGSKVQMVSDTVQRFIPDVHIIQIPTLFSEDTLVTTDSIVVSGVDSIESRKNIARSLMSQKNHWKYYIDARMGGNIVETFFVTPATIQEYWFDLLDLVPLEIPCSARSTSYNGMLAASLVSRLVAAVSMRQPVPAYLHIDMLGWSFDMGRLQEVPAVL